MSPFPSYYLQYQEGTSYAYAFNTHFVMLFDGKTLVRLYFTGNPLGTVPRIWVIRHGKEVPNTMRCVVLHAICEGLDMKYPNWI